MMARRVICNECRRIHYSRDYTACLACRSAHHFPEPTDAHALPPGRWVRHGVILRWEAAEEQERERAA